MKPSERAEAIFARIGDGHKNAVKRPWDTRTDRCLRRIIEKANNNGDCIIARRNGEGYYRPIPTDPVDCLEYRSYMKQEHAKVETMQLKEISMSIAFETRAVE